MAARVGLAGLRLTGVPVFLYHGLLGGRKGTPDATDPRFWLPAATFQAQLATLAREGIGVATLDELWTGQLATDHGRPAVLTFDDGRASDFEVAFPLLAEANARAEFFVNTGTVGHRGYVDWPDIRAMHQAGMSFQSHSHDHVVLLGLPRTALLRQLGDSRKLLEDRLGVAVRYLATPYGLADGRVVAAALEAGYRAVCTSWEWMARPGTRTISRLAIYPTTPLSEFRRLLQGRPGPFTRRGVRAGLVYLPKRILLRLHLERHDVQRLGHAR